MYRFIKFLTLFLLLSSCSKGGLIRPKLKLTLLAATIQADGSVLLEGNIDSEGSDKFQDLGFCFGDSLPTPNNSATIKDASANGKKFSVVYESTYFRSDLVYHFRAWARYNSEYTFSNNVSLTKIAPPAVTPTCTLTANTCNIGGGQPTSTMSQGTLNGRSVNASGNSVLIMMDFGGNGQLKNGIYKTVGSSGNYQGGVYMHFYSGIVHESLKAGSNVFVNLISTGLYEITICNAGWTLNGGSTLIPLNARFKSKLQ